MSPRVVAIVLALAFHCVAQAPPRPEFEVASVRKSANCETGKGSGWSPGRLNLICNPLLLTIRQAYSPTDGSRPPLVLSAPQWVIDDRYDIVANAPGDTPYDQMYGPMLRTLLEDRFHLKIHRETRELPVYLLTVAKGGPKMQRSAGVGCAPPYACGNESVEMDGTNRAYNIHNMTMAQLAARTLSHNADRPVIDNTGLPGLFDFHLEFADNMASDEVAASVFTAVRDQLGLKLSPGKGPVEVLVIDHIERPSGN